jgi:hypothetical protein
MSKEMKRVIKIIREVEKKNPYPYDIFPKLEESRIKLIGKSFYTNFGISLDRFSAHLMRISRNNVIEQIKMLLMDEMRNVSEVRDE